eukprot:scaffold112355_cov18-Prasinocladus_malaysianus.AAC.2
MLVNSTRINALQSPDALNWRLNKERQGKDANIIGVLRVMMRLFRGCHLLAQMGKCLCNFARRDDTSYKSTHR